MWSPGFENFLLGSTSKPDELYRQEIQLLQVYASCKEQYPMAQ
jgi:hypothetical protein